MTWYLTLCCSDEMYARVLAMRTIDDKTREKMIT